jgi:hypothetical protein
MVAHEKGDVGLMNLIGFIWRKMPSDCCIKYIVCLYYDHNHTCSTLISIAGLAIKPTKHWLTELYFGLLL